MGGFTETVQIGVPVRTAYDQWTQFESFPRFMSSVREVEQLRPAISRWVVGIGLLRREFYAEILEQRPDERVEWRSLDRHFRHQGQVTFRASGPRTASLQVSVEYEPWPAFLPDAVCRSRIQRKVRSELHCFKTFMESVGDAGQTWRGTIRRGRVEHREDAAPGYPGWRHG